MTEFKDLLFLNIQLDFVMISIKKKYKLRKKKIVTNIKWERKEKKLKKEIKRMKAIIVKINK